MRAVIGAALASVFVLACARDLRARYPLAPSEEEGVSPPATATVELRFTSAVKGLVVSVDGRLVVDGAHTQRVVIEQLPPGHVTVMVACEGAPERVFSLDLEPGGRVVVPLTGASGGGATSLWQTALGAAVTIGYLALRDAL
jgi:hypothetical protein